MTYVPLLSELWTLKVGFVSVHYQRIGGAYQRPSPANVGKVQGRKSRGYLQGAQRCPKEAKDSGGRGTGGSLLARAGRKVELQRQNTGFMIAKACEGVEGSETAVLFHEQHWR